MAKTTVTIILPANLTEEMQAGILDREFVIDRVLADRHLPPVGSQLREEVLPGLSSENGLEQANALSRLLPCDEEDCWWLLERLPPSCRSLLVIMGMTSAHPLLTAHVTLKLAADAVLRPSPLPQDTALVEAGGEMIDVVGILMTRLGCPATVLLDATGNLCVGGKVLSWATPEDRRRLAGLILDLLERGRDDG